MTAARAHGPVAIVERRAETSHGSEHLQLAGTT